MVEPLRSLGRDDVASEEVEKLVEGRWLGEDFTIGDQRIFHHSRISEH